MPHATDDMPSTLSNGDKPTSKFVSRVTSYPVVSDGIETFKSNPYGKKSLELAGDAYQRFGKPVEPYLETPLSYAKPYVEKADELADTGLQHVDARFPIVKEDTTTVIETGKSYVFWPYNYVYSAWNDEYTKTAKHNNRGDGLFTLIQALISVQLRIASDFFQFVSDYLGPKYDESKKKSADYYRHAQSKAEDLAQQGQKTFLDYKKLGEEKVDEYSSLGQQKTEEAKSKAEKTASEVKGQAKEAKEEGKQSAEQAKAKAQK